MRLLRVFLRRYASSARLPSVVAGLDVVDAARDEVRGALTEDEIYLRARPEVALASTALRVGDETLALSAAWRFLQELDAPSAVKSAGTDDASLLELRLALPRGWFVRYTAGEPPLDARYDSTFALGYELRL